ncbi:MAG: hypothetical protein ACHP9T_09385 [Caulobacterales bacterium]|jgi:hypothetical protein
MAESSRPTEPGHPVLAATPARQGRYGRPVFWVLVISTLLAAIGLFIAWTWRAPALSAPGGSQQATSKATASTFNAPEPAPITAPAGSDHTAPQAP